MTRKTKEPLYRRVTGNSLEEMAMSVGNNRIMLRERFREAISTMNREDRRLFSTTKLDFENKRAYSTADPSRYLQWLLRAYPDAPISYENQQTSLGRVYFGIIENQDDKQNP